MRLTSSWSISQEFAKHFPRCQELQTFLAEYLIRLVRLCGQLVSFSKRPAAVILAASFLSSFDAHFLPAQQELEQWGRLIEQKFNSLTAETTGTAITKHG